MLSYHPAYETLSERDVAEYRARGILVRHRKTGCEIYHLRSEDEENTFAFIFRTPPRDGTGVAHIVEHSVLCGSARYPVKDSFVVMARRSLATFLNALTYPDKTVYPAASAVKADYYNLMSVYADAVFAPLLSEETFLQEAHHEEFAEDGSLDIRGVVYNEMRGDYSSADSLAGTASSTSLFTPGHPYSFDSGGDPERIPSLTYEAFKAFWAEHYHPSNCRIYLHGNIDTTEQLEKLEHLVLGHFEAKSVATEIPLEPPRLSPARIEVPYPVSEGAESATQIIVNWLTAPLVGPLSSGEGSSARIAAQAATQAGLPAGAAEREAAEVTAEALGLEVLTEILLGHDGSPLAKALRDSGLGEDLSPQCGIDTGLRQIIFSAGLRGVKRGDEAKVEELILAEVGRVVKNGILIEARETALHSIAFSNKEIRRGGGTYELRLMNRCLRGWLHGAAPEATLGFEVPLAFVRERLEKNPRWLESLAEKWILSNPHRTTVTVFPDPGLLEKNKSERVALLAKRESSLSSAARTEIREKAEKLAALQLEADTPERLELIPRLFVKDLPSEIDVVPREMADIAGIPVSVHPIFTNGIIYLDLAFPIDSLPIELFPWLPFYTRFVAGAGLPGLPYDEVAELLAKNSGGFGAYLDAGEVMPGAPGARQKPFAAFAMFRLKALTEKFPAALDLAVRLLTEADASDSKRIGDLLAEIGNDYLSALVPAGNSFALSRAGAYHSQALAAEELWRGTTQLRFLADLREGREGSGAATGDTDVIDARKAGEILGAIGASIVCRRGLRMSLTADQADTKAALAALAQALPRLPREPGLPPAAGKAIDAPTAHEAYAISAQVGFAAAACASSRLGTREFVHETVLGHLLTTGSLWDELRVRRGAYGASMYIEGFEGVALFSTYRDPKPVESLSYFQTALTEAAEGKGMDSAEEAVVGTTGRDLKPLLPEERGLADFKRELYGVDDALRRAKRRHLLDTTAKDLQAAAARLSTSFEKAATVLISHEEDIQYMQRLRGDTRIVRLPI